VWGWADISSWRDEESDHGLGLKPARSHTECVAVCGRVEAVAGGMRGVTMDLGLEPARSHTECVAVCGRVVAVAGGLRRVTMDWV
jgi:hypothetical protein